MPRDAVPHSRRRIKQAEIFSGYFTLHLFMLESDYLLIISVVYWFF